MLNAFGDSYLGDDFLVRKRFSFFGHYGEKLISLRENSNHKIVVGTLLFLPLEVLAIASLVESVARIAIAPAILITAGILHVHEKFCKGSYAEEGEFKEFCENLLWGVGIALKMSAICLANPIAR